jgi:DNA-binding NtrC family response regulator
MRMLLVEDDKMLGDALSVFFRIKGCDLLHVPDAEEALALLDRETFGVVISDHWLPGADGLTLLKRVAEQQPEALRVLITAGPTAELATDAMVEGVDGFILKPFTGEELETALAEVLGKGRDCGDRVDGLIVPKA